MPNQNYNPKENKSFNWEEYKRQELMGEEEKEVSFAEGRKMETTGEQVSAEKDDSYQNILSQVKTTQTQNDDDDDDDSIKDEADFVFQKRTRDEQVEHLVKLAFDKGVVHAVGVAQKMDDFYILDQLHDTLVRDDLHKVLVSKGLIEEN